tara:strand:- start:2878 stop:3213 length:336 start_codon:yes stop_codon:yes gene_type:complete
LHWIANPGPSGRPGSNPGRGVFLNRHIFDILCGTMRKSNPYDESIYRNTLKRLEEDSDSSSINKKHVKEFMRDRCELHNGTPLSVNRRTKYLMYIRIIARALKKVFKLALI